MDNETDRRQRQNEENEGEIVHRIKHAPDRARRGSEATCPASLSNPTGFLALGAHLIRRCRSSVGERVDAICRHPLSFPRLALVPQVCEGSTCCRRLRSEQCAGAKKNNASAAQLLHPRMRIVRPTCRNLCEVVVVPF